jgi:hypothetical protein
MGSGLGLAELGPSEIFERVLQGDESPEKFTEEVREAVTHHEAEEAEAAHGSPDEDRPDQDAP